MCDLLQLTFPWEVVKVVFFTGCSNVCRSLAPHGALADQVQASRILHTSKLNGGHHGDGSGRHSMVSHSAWRSHRAAPCLSLSLSLVLDSCPLLAACWRASAYWLIAFSLQEVCLACLGRVVKSLINYDKLMAAVVLWLPGTGHLPVLRAS